MKQVPPFTTWPSGEGQTVAILGRTPAELALAYGLRFEEGCDGLGAYDLAAVEDDRLGQLWFFAHRQAPRPGTEVVVDAAADPAEGVRAARRHLRPRDADFTGLA